VLLLLLRRGCCEELQPARPRRALARAVRTVFSRTAGHHYGDLLLQADEQAMSSSYAVAAKST
jgi:hypothetical protein